MTGQQVRIFTPIDGQAQLMRVICPNSEWSKRFKILLEKEFPLAPHGQLSLKDMGVVRGWEDWEIWHTG